MPDKIDESNLPEVEAIMEDMFQAWSGKKKHRTSFYNDLKRLLEAEKKRLNKQTSKAEYFARFVQTDYIELSYEKAMWQRNDWRKRSLKVFEG